MFGTQDTGRRQTTQIPQKPQHTTENWKDETHGFHQ